MPDLDQIKQAEQGCGTGAGGSRGAGRAIPPAGQRGCRDHVNRAARLLLAGEGVGKALTTRQRRLRVSPMRPVSPKVTSVTRAPPLETRCSQGLGRARR